MNIEYELKYRADRVKLDAMEADFPGEGEPIQMETAYYDTPDGFFSAKRITLRRRLENGVPVCTLKLPGVGIERREYEVTEADIALALPRLCAMAELPLPPGTPVRICGARFTRTARLLTYPEFTAELALDRGILMGGERIYPLMEAELELKSGSREALGLFGRILELKYCIVPEPESKFSRALALAKEG